MNWLISLRLLTLAIVLLLANLVNFYRTTNHAIVSAEQCNTVVKTNTYYRYYSVYFQYGRWFDRICIRCIDYYWCWLYAKRNGDSFKPLTYGVNEADRVKECKLRPNATDVIYHLKGRFAMGGGETCCYNPSSMCTPPGASPCTTIRHKNNGNIFSLHNPETKKSKRIKVCCSDVGNCSFNCGYPGDHYVSRAGMKEKTAIEESFCCDRYMND